MAEYESLGICLFRNDFAGNEAAFGDELGGEGRREEVEDFGVEGGADGAVGAVRAKFYAACGVPKSGEEGE
jgi:hypothetical protein